MAEGKEKAAWWHTAHQIAAVCNVNRTKGRKPLEPKQFHPYFAKAPVPQARLTKKTFHGLWAACGGK